MALILSLETSASICSVALHENNVLVNSLEVFEGQAHASKLAVLIDQIFKASNTAFSQLNAVAVSAGPGSYTGLRIGTSVAKGLCYALDLPLIACNTLDALAHAFKRTHQVDNELLCPMIDARRMEVYTQIFDVDLQPITQVEPKVIDESSFSELLNTNKVLLFGDGSEKCKTVLKHDNAVFVDNIFPMASDLGFLASEKFSSNEFVDVINFKPFYLKEFVAKKSQSPL